MAITAYILAITAIIIQAFYYFFKVFFSAIALHIIFKAMKRFLLIHIFLCCIAHLYAQQKEFIFKNFTQEEGLPVPDAVVFVNADEIIRCEARGSYSIVYINNKKNITCSRTLKELEDILTAQNFIRVHNSWVINTKYLKKYYRGKNSYMEMEDGSTVTISLRKKGDLLSFLKDFE